MSRAFTLLLLSVSSAVVLPLVVAIARQWTISTDLLFYANALTQFSAQLWQGEWYPRWLTATNDGLGSPVFLFYSPLPFYIASLFAPISAWDTHGFFRIALSMFAALVVMGISARRWLMLYFDEKKAQTGALMYVSCPYLLIQLYSGFNPSQLWALAIVTFLLHAAHGITQKSARSLPQLALGYALLALTHLPSLIVFFPVPWLYVAVFSHAKRMRNMLYAAFAGLIGALISALYLLPALLNKPFIAERGYLEGKFNYANGFYDIFTFIYLCIILLPMLGYFLELPRERKKQMRAPEKFWLAMLAWITFMVSPLSKPIWDHVFFLPYLQFPFRYFLISVPATVFLVLAWMDVIKSKGLWIGLNAGVLLMLSSIGIHGSFLDTDKHTADILADRRIVVPEYATVWMEKEGIVTLKLPDAGIRTDKPEILSGRGTVELRLHEPRRMVIEIDTRDTISFTLPRFYFPGWEAPDGVTVAPHAALISVTAPPGTKEIILTLPYYAGERMGMWLSLAGIVLLITASRLSRRWY